MKYNELKLTKHQTDRRVGRGIAAGQGKTAGRGTKGQGARKSGGVRPGFEGGQMPLYMRIPKLRGFKSHRVKAEVVYTGQLDLIKAALVDNEAVSKAGLSSSQFTVVKLISKGTINTKKEVRLQAASASAIKSLEQAGGSFTTVGRQPRPAKKKTKE
jgi:large subunit ribosomal protein L15